MCEIQWPLARDEATVKLDDSHYFFALRAPGDHCRSDSKGSSNEDDDRRKIKAPMITAHGLGVIQSLREECVGAIVFLLDCGLDRSPDVNTSAMMLEVTPQRLRNCR